jgi:hypothetical protein
MSKDQEYHPLINDPAEEFEAVSPPLKPTWISRTFLAWLLAVETAALALAIVALFTRARHTACTVPLDSQRVLYCERGCLLLLKRLLTSTPSSSSAWSRGT